jgi:protease-4
MSSDFAPLSSVLTGYDHRWLMEPQAGFALAGMLNGINLHVHMQEVEASGVAVAARSSVRSSADGCKPFDFDPESGIAFLSASGPLTKRMASWGGGTSTVRLRQQARAMLRDKDVNGVLFRGDSPGGQVSGTADAAEDIYRLSQEKPVVGLIEDMGASAMYWLISQCGYLMINRTGLAPCMGTYMAIADSSGYYAQNGVKIYVISSGGFKGAGVDGTEITEAQRAEWQREVKTLNSHFLAGVARGRNMDLDDVTALADGRVHVGQEVVDLGLADSVGSFDDAMEMLLAAIADNKHAARRGKETIMSQPTATKDGEKKQSIAARIGAAIASVLGPEAEAEDAQAQPQAGAENIDAQAGTPAKSAREQELETKIARMEAEQREKDAAGFAESLVAAKVAAPAERDLLAALMLTVMEDDLRDPLAITVMVNGEEKTFESRRDLLEAGASMRVPNDLTVEIAESSPAATAAQPAAGGDAAETPAQPAADTGRRVVVLQNTQQTPRIDPTTGKPAQGSGPMTDTRRQELHSKVPMLRNSREKRSRTAAK